LLPSKGTATINGYDILEEPEKVRGSIGLVNSEERSFYWRLTAKQNLKFFAAMHNLYGEEADENINRTLSLVGLKNKNNSRYDSFSTGMKQRLLFARALLNNPKIIFMDEPTKGMDIKIAKKMKELIIKFKKEKTIFLTTHNMKEAEDLCDRIGVIHKGSILAAGALDELRRKTKQKELEEIFFKLAK